MYTKYLARKLKEKMKLRDMERENQSSPRSSIEEEEINAKYQKAPKAIQVVPVVKRKVSRLSSLAKQQQVKEIFEVNDMFHKMHSRRW